MCGFFVQDCPTCGRRLHIHSARENDLVVCPHCRGSFCAGEDAPRSPHDDWRPALVRRADELLAQLAAQTELAGAA